MTPEERELRSALEGRSAGPSTEFRSRLTAALEAGRPVARTSPTFALVAAACLAMAMVGVLLMVGQGVDRTTHGGPASGPRSMATPTPIAMPSFAQLSAPSQNVVWVLVAGEYLARSTDRGNTWAERPLPSVDGGFPQPEISFVDDHEGWLSSGGSPATQCSFESVSIWHTTDAGATWTSFGTKGISDSQCKERLSFVDSKRGFIDAWDVNHAPVIYRTTDGGRTWAASQPLPDPPGFKTTDAGFVLYPGLVRAYGSTLLVPAFGQASGVDMQYVFRSTDGGATWAYVAAKPTNGGFAFVTATRWLQLILPDQSFETTDAGATWHPYSSDYSQAAGVAPQFVFADFVVGYGTVRGSIARTVDGGRHWVWITTPGA